MRNPKAVIFTSSYDRGLEHLLRIWPDVKKAVPEAELHIFYGWDLFVRFNQNNPASMAWKARVDELMNQEGVTHHGRVPQKELVPWIEQCGVWAYPTHFYEISCISAMKAQCYGAIPVVINYAALRTTVQHGVKVDGDIYDKDVRDKYKEELIKMLNNPDQEKIRKPMMKWAKKEFPWSKVATNWIKEFKETI